VIEDTTDIGRASTGVRTRRVDGHVRRDLGRPASVTARPIRNARSSTRRSQVQCASRQLTRRDAESGWRPSSYWAPTIRSSVTSSEDRRLIDGAGRCQGAPWPN
jgi:hypothetical protein